MILNLKEMSPSSIYHTMIQTIVPRPIAWVLTDNGNQSLNLAPFSYFTGLTSTPPILCISVGKKKDGEQKDTWKNIEHRDHFVVHIADESLAGPVNESSLPLDHGESELDRLGLKTVPFEGSPLPRLEAGKIALFCSKERIIEVGDGPQALILGRIHSIYIDDSICKTDEKQRVILDQKALSPLSRLGGIEYGTLGEVIRIDRPQSSH